MNVALFDYRAGNLHSLKKALEAGGASVSVTPSWEEALYQDALVLPGVGSFGSAVASLGDEREWIRAALEGGLPTLGICLGMQLLFDRSEEGGGQGIGLISGSVKRLKTRVIPQMGWNDVVLQEDPLFREVSDLVAYYANSYVCVPDDPDVVIAHTKYEDETFPAAVRRNRIWGVQFHPEKSSGPGLMILRNFLREVQQGLGGGEE